MKKYNKNIHLKFKIALAVSIFGMSLNINAQTVDEQKVCKEKIESIQKDDKNFARLNKIFKDHSKFGIQKHTMMPGFHSDYQDLVQARKQLSKEDIPYIVHELARMEKLNNRQITAMGVLTQFGTDAIPCINAALEKQNCPGCFNLGQTKISIEVNEKVKKN